MEILINNTKLYYETNGIGSNMLILHGWGGCINSMRPIIDEYSKTYKVTALDFPGHGKSSIPNSWNVTDYMNCIYKFITELSLTDITIISHSFGGRVSILLSALHPELIKKLILIDSGGLIPKRTPQYYIKLYTYKVGKKIMQITIKDTEKYTFWLENQRKKRSSSDYNELIPEMRSTFIKVINQNLKKYLKKISCPTLIIWGEFDKSTPPYMSKIMNKQIKNSQLYILENCGHFSYLDDFATFNSLVNNFLNN